MPDLNFCPHCGHDLTQYNSAESSDSDDGSIYPKAVEFVIEAQRASSALLQRRFKIGYARAARLIDLLEENDIVSPANGAKPRTVLFENYGDYVYSQAASMVVKTEYVSINSLSASLHIDEKETKSILEKMENRLIIGPADPDGIHPVLRQEV